MAWEAASVVLFTVIKSAVVVHKEIAMVMQLLW